MDLREYEQAKFGLAEVIRSAQVVDRAPVWGEFLKRLAEDRFTVVVAGRFSRGKSSLMNAVLGMDRLPTGIVPLTSVITYVRYGSSDRVLLEHQDMGLQSEAALEDLADWVAERGNPGNVKRIRSAEIQLPAEILRRGFFFVDTPGLGSAILENTETTESFVPEIDMLVLVTGFESPLSDDEFRFLQRASGVARAIFVVVNKQDTVAPQEREEVLRYVEERIRAALGPVAFRLFSVSAKNGLTAKQAGDARALKESGIAEFETELASLLTRDRAELFLSSMCARTREALGRLPEGDARLLSTRLQGLSAGLHATLPSTTSPIAAGPRARSCTICRAVVEAQSSFLAGYQYELDTSASAREQHARNGGFCTLHTWHYAQVASPRGICAGYPPLLTRTAELLRAQVIPVAHCPVCKARRETEDALVEALLRAPGRSSGLCLPHLRVVVERSNDGELRNRLFPAEAAVLERLAEDMQRYAVKHDGLRRDLASDEERYAPMLALQLLVGAAT